MATNLRWLVYSLCWCALLSAAPMLASAQAPADGATAGTDATAPDPKDIEPHELLGYDIDLTDPYISDVEVAIELLLQKGQVKEARTALEAAAKKQPNLPPIDVLMAKLFDRAGNGNQARLLLEKAAKDSPEDPEAFVILAEFALRQGHIAVPQACYDKARGLLNGIKNNELRKAKLKTRLLGGYAAIAERHGDWDQVIKLLSYLARGEKEPFALYQRLGNAYFQKNNESAAYDSFEKAAQINKELPDARVMMARLLQGQSKFDAALRYVEEAMRLPNANLPTRLGVSLFLVVTDRTELAAPYVEATRKEFPDSASIQILAGIIARYQRDYSRAQERFESAQRLEPGNALAANLVALANATSSDEADQKRGVSMAQENVRRNPQSRDAHIALGWIYYKLGRIEEAQKTIDPALKAGSFGPDSSYFVAKILFDQQRYDNARQLLDSALNSQALFVHREEAKALMGNLDIERLRQSVAPK